MFEVKHKFHKGDLVKNGEHVKWRDETARGVVVESHHTATMVGSERNQVVYVKWICPPAYADKGTQFHYSNSLDLVAGVSR